MWHLIATAIENGSSKIRKWLNKHCAIKINWRKENAEQTPNPHPIFLETNDHL